GIATGELAHRGRAQLHIGDHVEALRRELELRRLRCALGQAPDLRLRNGPARRGHAGAAAGGHAGEEVAHAGAVVRENAASLARRLLARPSSIAAAAMAAASRGPGARPATSSASEAL